MFNIPEWEDDIPKTNVNFVKNDKNNKKKKIKQVKPGNETNHFKQNKHQTMSSGRNTKRLKPRSKGHTAKKIENKILKKKRKQAKNHKQIETNVEKENQQFRHDEKSDEVKKDNCDIEKLDELLLNVQKKKLNDQFHNDDREELLFSNQETNKVVEQIETVEPIEALVPNNEKTTKPIKTSHVTHTISKSSKNALKDNKKKLIFKKLLENNLHRNSITVSGSQLRERMLEKLKSAQFRYLNEKLYTLSGSEAQNLFKSDPMAFKTYHQGYQQQVKKWPVNPLDVIVKKIMKMPKSFLIADLGCGEAALAKQVPHKVRSFDLVATSEGVEVCDMAHTPLLSSSVDVAVYCLALMGTDLTQYLIEANRVLKVGGNLLIAEVESRFDDVDTFAKEVQRLGFKLKEIDKNQQVFYFIQFTKTQSPPVKKSKLPELTLRPCLYKKR